MVVPSSVPLGRVCLASSWEGQDCRKVWEEYARPKRIIETIWLGIFVNFESPKHSMEKDKECWRVGGGFKKNKLDGSDHLSNLQPSRENTQELLEA